MGSLTKVKYKEKTKLMRKLTKTNCPEALDDILVPVVDDKDSDDDDVRNDDSRDDDSRNDDDDDDDSRDDDDDDGRNDDGVMMKLMTGQDIADHNGQGGSGQGCWCCSCFWSSW